MRKAGRMGKVGKTLGKAGMSLRSLTLGYSVSLLVSVESTSKDIERSRRHFEFLPERIDADRLRVNSGVLSNISSSRAIRYPDHPNC